MDELAARAGVSVDTVRFYQARGLLHPPDREGRVAWYSGEHLDRLGRIRDLKERGLTLETIGRVLAGGLDAADEALVAAVAGPGPGAAEEPLHTIEDLAERTGVAAALLAPLLRTVEREGLLVPSVAGGEPRYSQADLEAAVAGLSLLEAGLPFEELLALARDHHEATRAVAERAVELFDAYVRGPVRESASSEEEAGRRLVEAFRRLLPAATRLVAYHFERVLLAAARERIARAGEDPAPLEDAWSG